VKGDAEKTEKKPRIPSRVFQLGKRGNLKPNAKKKIVKNGWWEKSSIAGRPLV